MEKEVESREGLAAAHLVMALLHYNEEKRPSASEALRLPIFTEDPLFDLQGRSTPANLCIPQSLLPDLARQQRYWTSQQVGVTIQDVLVSKQLIASLDRRLDLDTAAAFLVLHCGSWKVFACGLACDMLY